MDEAKKNAAAAAAALVKNGQSLGLGTGSTAAFAIEELGRRVKEEQLEIACAASSYDSAFLAAKAGLNCIPLENVSELDLSIDGADEVDPQFYLIKGGGASHAREKLMHAMSKRFVLIADASKKVQILGQNFPVPVEILPSARAFVCKKLAELGGQNIQVRMSSGKRGPLFTDNGNWIIDAHFKITEPLALEIKINEVPGVLENGIFARIRPQKQDCFIV